jgi:hypothetical protein
VNFSLFFVNTKFIFPFRCPLPPLMLMFSDDTFFLPFQVIKLYERCVIACASYSEFWIRYVQCMEDKGSLELANNALARATHVFVKV